MMAVHRTIVAIILCLFFLSWSTLAAFEKRPVRFPGERSQMESPDGRYVLINVDSENKEQILSLGGNHALFLQNSKTGKKEKIYSYDRYVEVLWSPNGRRMIINDYGGSDYAFPIIFSFDGNIESINVEDKVRRELADNRSIIGNHHVFIIGTEWLGEDKVKIKIYGYGDVDPKGFTLWYEYQISDKFKFIKKGPLENK